MTARFVDIRPGEHRIVLAAFLTLFAVVAGHVVLETARDALFLTALPARRLPWTYLGIAALSLAIFALEARRERGRVSRRSLSAWLVGVGLLTAGFWAILGSRHPALLYALYIWTGLVSTLVLVRFWTLAGEFFSIAQAKRLLALVGLGSIVGAVAGSALARLLALSLPVRDLVLVAAFLFLAAAIAPLCLPAVSGAEEPAAREAGRIRLRETLLQIHRDGYLRKVGAIVLLATIAFTWTDYLFKVAVAQRVPAERLGSFFASAYLLFNVFSLATQLLLVRYLVPIVRRLKIDQFLAVLPSLVAAGAAAVALGGGLPAAYGLKALDGGLRHSLHRTSTEMLFVPITSSARGAIKGWIDALGQRGGQALASVVILAATAVGARWEVLAGVTVILAVGWMAAARALRPEYLQLFRSRLGESAIGSRIDYPQLDLASLESLIRSLNSADNGEVLAAIDLLAEKNRIDLIPALILYHPAREVVVRALQLFAQGAREDALPVLDRLFERDDPEIRAAALRARLWMAPDPERIARMAEDPSPLVRAGAWVGQISLLGSEEVRERLLHEAAHGSEEIQLGLARAIRYSPSPAFEEALVQMARAGSDAVAIETAAAMREIRSTGFVPVLIEMLASRARRSEARRTLVTIGPDALSALEKALANRWLDPRVRRHLPRSIHRFENQRAVDILSSRLPGEPDPAVEHKMLRALGRLSAERPDLEFDDRVFRIVAELKLRAAFHLLDLEIRLTDAGAIRPERRTSAHQLLIALLAHKRSIATEHLFRLLGILYRSSGEDWREIHRATTSPRVQKRASARELLEDLLEPPLREPLLLLVDDIDPRAKVLGAAPFFRAGTGRYEDVLRSLLHFDEIGLRCLVAYHAGELGLVDLVEALEELPSDREGLVSQSVEHALVRLRGVEQALRGGAS